MKKALALGTLGLSLLATTQPARADLSSVLNAIDSSPRCEQETDLSTLSEGVWQICYHGRQAIAAVHVHHTDLSGAYDRYFAQQAGDSEAMGKLLESKCGTNTQARFPNGIINNIIDGKAYAIAPQGIYDAIQCR